jgi:hypothetical protein
MGGGEGNSKINGNFCFLALHPVLMPSQPLSNNLLVFCQVILIEEVLSSERTSQKYSLVETILQNSSNFIAELQSFAISYADDLLSLFIKPCGFAN